MNPVSRFVLKVLLWLPLCYAIWYYSSIIFTLPLAWTLDVLMQWSFADLIGGISAYGNRLSVLTHLEVTGANGARGVMRFYVDALDYGYSLPLYSALVLASPGKDSQKFRSWLIGLTLLLLVQLFGVGTDILKTLAFDAGAAATRQVGLSPRAHDVLVFAASFGYLILPSVAPILIWVAQFRGFLANLAAPITRTAREDSSRTKAS